MTMAGEKEPEVRHWEDDPYIKMLQEENITLREENKRLRGSIENVLDHAHAMEQEIIALKAAQGGGPH